MNRTRWTKVVAAGITTAFVLAACGSSSKSATPTTAGGAATTTAAGGPSSTAAGNGSSTTTGGSETTGTSTTKMGLIDGVYKGSGGFSIDPKKCPSDWNPKQGISDTEIDLFASLPTSGPFAGFGLLTQGANAYFKVINDAGGIGGRKIVLEAKDDGYAPDKTKTNVDEALGSNKYASLAVVLGTANNLAIWDKTNDECMPQLLNATGAAQWGDVEHHPWTTGMQLDYFTEAALWAKWLLKEHPEAKTVAEVTFNNDFGKSYAAGFKNAIKGSDLKVVDSELHEPTAPNLTNQFTTMAASKADVVLIETSGVFCTQAMSEIEKNTSWHPIVIMSGTCASLTQFFKPLIDQGLTGKDTFLVQNYKDPNDPANADDPIVKQFHDTMTAQGLDPKQTTYATGWIFAWYMVDILKNAATYEGGLDRGNIILAARDVQETNPWLINGLTSKTNGLKDAYLTEGGQMVQYKVTDPKQFGTFVHSGDLINLEGQLGTYATVVKALAGS